MRKILSFLLVLIFSSSILAEEYNYSVGDVHILNNREVPDEIVLSLMNLKPGSLYSVEEMVADYNRIKTSDYVENVSIFPRLQNGSIELEVSIEEVANAKDILIKDDIIPKSEREISNETLIVRSVEVVGNNLISTSDILAEIPIKVGSTISRARVRSGQEAIIGMGYFQNVEVSTSDTSSGIKIRYHVEENPVIRGIKISGNTVYTEAELLELFDTKGNEIYNTLELRDDIGRVIDKYKKDGYILADVLAAGVNHDNFFELRIAEGEIEDIQIRRMITKQKGARRDPEDSRLKTKEYIIRRELDFKVGEIYNINDFESTRAALERSGIFKEIRASYQQNPNDPFKNTIIMLIDEERTASIQGSLSYGSEVGILGTISLIDSNWQGLGQSFGVTYERSDDDYEKFSLEFKDPWIRGTDRISWGWSVYKTQYEDSDSFLFNDIETIGADLEVGKGIGRNYSFNFGSKVEYVNEDDDDGHDTDDYVLTSIYPSLTYSTRNNPFNPSSGIYARLQLEGGYAGGEYDPGLFRNISLDTRYYHRGFWRGNVFAYRVVGAVASNSTKESQRYRVGGGNTLRGFDGSYYRGKEKITFSIENRSQINDVFGIVAFLDAGRAWDQDGADPRYNSKGRDDEGIPHDIGVGAGVGIRLNTPVGPLRFDFGWPLTNNDEDEGLQFYFNAGHTF